MGPILWQFPPTRIFDPAVSAAFLALLPPEHGGLALRHVVEARHASFVNPEWFAQLRKHQVAAAIIDSDKHRLLGDLTAPFVYARLQRNSSAEPAGYEAKALQAWAKRAKTWAAGKPVTDLELVAPPAAPAPRTCFMFFISGDKVRAPDAAQAFMAKLAASDSKGPRG